MSKCRRRAIAWGYAPLVALVVGWMGVLIVGGSVTTAAPTSVPTTTSTASTAATSNASPTTAASASAPLPTTVSAATLAATEPVNLGPDVVMLKELAHKYAPVPFEHRKHAVMAQMHGGCLTCHHRPPTPQTQPAATQPATTPPTVTMPATTAATALIVAIHPLEPAAPPTTAAQWFAWQDHAAQTPACVTCHEKGAAEASVTMPGLKGAYHRQCLNCHREWMGENLCGACHKEITAATAQADDHPSAGDILGRMHPPIPQPDDEVYHARYTPADGSNVLFRHKQHTNVYHIPCVACHRESNCSSCHHDGTSDAPRPRPRPVQPSRTWAQSHEPCFDCHRQERCSHCHYDDSHRPPPTFDHARTGQALDKDHAALACIQCHPRWQWSASVTCGDSSCHSGAKVITFPAQRPGLWNPAATQPTTTSPGGPTMDDMAAITPGPGGGGATSQPGTTMQRIRR